jgi:predicted RNA polymerase sigma factor
LRLYAQLYQATGKYSEARRFYQQAIALARGLGDNQAEVILPKLMGLRFPAVLGRLFC